MASHLNGYIVGDSRQPPHMDTTKYTSTLIKKEQIDVVEDHLRLVALLCETAKQIDRERLIAFYAVAAPEKLK